MCVFYIILVEIDTYLVGCVPKAEGLEERRDGI
jgi:hypothetical protein